MSSTRRSISSQQFPGPEDLDLVETGADRNGGQVPKGTDLSPVESVKTVRDVGAKKDADNNGQHRARSAFAAVRQRIKDGKKPWGTPDDPLWASHPILAEWLMLRTLDGIRIREVASLSLSATPTGFAATLSDYYLGIKLPVKADTLLGIFDTLERELNRSEAAWIELEKGSGAERRKDGERKKLDERGIKRDNVLPEGEEEKNG